jgi:hypothetical protein
MDHPQIGRIIMPQATEDELETVAAICNSANDFDYDRLPDGVQERWRVYGRAAIEAGNKFRASTKGQQHGN